MRYNYGLESIASRIKLSEPWMVEVEQRPDEEIIIVNLISKETGEIRQKRVSFDTLARRVFASELKTWAKRWPKSLAISTESRLDAAKKGGEI